MSELFLYLNLVFMFTVLLILVARDKTSYIELISIQILRILKLEIKTEKKEPPDDAGGFRKHT